MCSCAFCSGSSGAESGREDEEGVWSTRMWALLTLPNAECAAASSAATRLEALMTGDGD
jgi:hypothetical protein